MEPEMKTPLRNRLNVVDNSNMGTPGTPLFIPASPLLQRLGFGTGVGVYRIERTNVDEIRSPWAIKRINMIVDKDRQKIYGKRLKDEAKILGTLNHPNIIGFRGFKKTDDGRETLLMEECQISLGDMLEQRFDNHAGPLLVRQIKRLAHDMAKALDYLHTKARLLHGDFKSFNILVKGDFEICKLCDFGVSQPLNEEGYLDLIRKPDAAYIGTTLWSAPEALLDNNTENIGSPSDIFSYGLVIYECIALIPPHTDSMSGNFKETSKVDRNEKLTDDRYNTSETIEGSDSDYSALSFSDRIGSRPSIPEKIKLSDSYNVIIEIFYVCTNHLPEDRPTAAFLTKLFNELDLDEKVN